MTNFHIERPAIAMSLAIALNRVMAIFTQAVENDDPVLLGVCTATMVEWLACESSRSKAIASSIYCQAIKDELGNLILDGIADVDHPVNVIELQMFTEMVRSLEGA